jgi:long-chain-fatty-acid--CoA ligase ACSBG
MHLVCNAMSSSHLERASAWITEAKPTVFFAVPRVWEKFSEAIQLKGKAMKGTAMGSVSAWAKGKVAKAYKESQAGGAAGWTPMGYSVANKLVSKARGALGLERCEFMYTGAAPITRETLEYFGSLGIKVGCDAYCTMMLVV